MSISDDMGATGSGSQSQGMPQGRETDGGQGGVTQSIKNAGSEIGNYAANKASQIKDTAQEYLHSGREKAEEYLHSGAEKAHEYYDMSRKKAMELEQNVENYIREKPLQSVLIAAGVGALLGFLLRR